MRSDSLQELAPALEIDNPRQLWGVSHESTYAALDAVASDQSLADALEGYYTLAQAATNQERDRQTFVEFHRQLLPAMGLVIDDRVTEIGAFVLRGDDPHALLQTLIAIHSEATRRLLRDCITIDDIIPQREYETLLRDDYEATVITPLLGSFGLIRVFPDGAEVSVEAVERALAAHDATAEEQARATLYQNVLASFTGIGVETAGDITAEALSRQGGADPGTAIVGTLGAGEPTLFDYETVWAAVEAVRAEYDRVATRCANLLTAGNRAMTVAAGKAVTAEDIREQVDADADGVIVDLLSMVATEQLERVHAQYVAARLDLPLYSAFSAINGMPDVDCELEDEILVFNQVPAVSGGTNHYDQYVKFLLNERERLVSRRDGLTEATIEISGIDVDEHLSRRVTEISDKQVAPTYFTYTLINPDALGEEIMEKYVGDSRGLGRERAQLRRWHKAQSGDLRSYTAMTDRLFELGLESDLDQQVLRIMTPYDDDTFSEYAAQLRRLLETGHELRFLTRHTKDSWEWKRLRDSLLKPLESNRDQVTIRTYSRFKKHTSITPDTNWRNVSEVGIHGKLHIMGGPHEGAALLGSANFVENSYHWNPECGIYTEQTAFVEAAMEFFDIVWDLAEADQLSLERLQQIPNRDLIPSYYSK